MEKEDPRISLGTIYFSSTKLRNTYKLSFDPSKCFGEEIRNLFWVSKKVYLSDFCNRFSWWKTSINLHTKNLSKIGTRKFLQIFLGHFTFFCYLRWNSWPGSDDKAQLFLWIMMILWAILCCNNAFFMHYNIDVEL